jgi:hypothetical protein
VAPSAEIIALRTARRRPWLSHRAADSADSSTSFDILLEARFLELRTVNPGFDPERSLAVTMQVNLTGVTRPIPHIVQRREEWIARLSRIPGVVSVGSITSLPLRNQCGDDIEFVRSDGTGAPGGGGLRAVNCLVSAGYLKTMGNSVAAGRRAGG